MFRGLHGALTSCWLGRRPGSPTKIHSAMCFISTHSYFISTFVLFILGIKAFENYSQHMSCDIQHLTGEKKQCFYDIKDIQSVVLVIPLEQETLPIQMVIMIFMPICLFYIVSLIWVIMLCMKQMCGCFVTLGLDDGQPQAPRRIRNREAHPDQNNNQIIEGGRDANADNVDRNVVDGSSHQIRRNNRGSRRQRRNRQNSKRTSTQPTQQQQQDIQLSPEQIELRRRDMQQRLQMQREMDGRLFQLGTSADSAQMQILGNYFAANNYLHETAREEQMLRTSGRQQSFQIQSNPQQQVSIEDSSPIECDICGQTIPFNCYIIHVQSHIPTNTAD
ncbi:MAG: hypothetical protein EZS28_011612 [Streblomastix strix]|uniref:Uncharacterized protein n=1 Tax=Streblomastix strix TaxID=222440 RepID=A0A5J4WD59_9EUKA|nr:MAG: hypothetical protein EZS28_011612 [Streblomastix strix]